MAAAARRCHQALMSLSAMNLPRLSGRAASLHFSPFSLHRPSSVSLVKYCSSQPAPPPGRERQHNVISVTNDAEYHSALSLAQDKGLLAITYFTAKWCVPCGKTISPLVDELSVKHEKAQFIKCDIDEAGLKGILNDIFLTSVPTFHFYKDGKQISKIVGANAQGLRDRVAILIKNTCS